jgi:hypothetical protein
MPVEFEPNGQKSSALNGGQEFTFTGAISIVAPCADKAEATSLPPGGSTPVTGRAYHFVTYTVEP